MATATPTELTDKQWELIAPLLPKRAWTGRPRGEDRKTINGIYGFSGQGPGGQICPSSMVLPLRLM